MEQLSMSVIFISESIGTALLLLLGGGVAANVQLAKTAGHAGGTLMTTLGWGIAVFVGVSVAAASGAHLNPAISLAHYLLGTLQPAQLLTYWAAQFLGAMTGAALVYLTYFQHFRAERDASRILAVFSNSPAIRNRGWNLVTEIIGTFVLVFVVLAFATSEQTPASLGALPVALLVVGIGLSLGGPTGYAINPARDLGPRIVHALLPIANKGSSDWSYAWIPVLGPLAGGALAAAASPLLG